MEEEDEIKQKSELEKKKQELKHLRNFMKPIEMEVLVRHQKKYL